MNTSVHEGTALIVDASSAVGEAYADRLARRGYDLILVSTDAEALLELATRLTDQTHRSVETITADLMDNTALTRVERSLRTDASITLLVSNAGTPVRPPAEADENALLALNVWRMVRLTSAVLPALIVRGKGIIINVLPDVPVVSGLVKCIQAGSNAFVVAFTQSLQSEFANRGIRIQSVVLSAATTELPNSAGLTFNQSLASSQALETVDLALAGLDRGELVTIPRQPGQAAQDTLEAKRPATGLGRSQANSASPSKH